MGKVLGGRAAFQRTPVRDRVAEGIGGWIADVGIEIIMIGQAPGRTLAGKLAGENGIEFTVPRQLGHGHRRLQLQPRQRLSELLGIE